MSNTAPTAYGVGKQLWNVPGVLWAQSAVLRLCVAWIHVIQTLYGTLLSLCCSAVWTLIH